MEQPLRSWMLKVQCPVLVKVVSEDGKLEKVYQLSLSAKAPTGSAIPEEGLRIWSYQTRVGD